MNGITLRLSAGVTNYCLEVIYILFQSLSIISVISNGYVLAPKIASLKTGSTKVMTCLIMSVLRPFV